MKLPKLHRSCMGGFRHFTFIIQKNAHKTIATGQDWKLLKPSQAKRASPILQWHWSWQHLFVKGGVFLTMRCHQKSLELWQSGVRSESYTQFISKWYKKIVRPELCLRITVFWLGFSFTKNEKPLLYFELHLLYLGQSLRLVATPLNQIIEQTQRKAHVWRHHPAHSYQDTDTAALPCCCSSWHSLCLSKANWRLSWENS